MLCIWLPWPNMTAGEVELSSSSFDSSSPHYRERRSELPSPPFKGRNFVTACDRIVNQRFHERSIDRFFFDTYVGKPPCSEDFSHAFASFFSNGTPSLACLSSFAASCKVEARLACSEQQGGLSDLGYVDSRKVKPLYSGVCYTVS